MGRRRANILLRVVLVGIPALVLLSCLGIHVPGTDLLIHVALGWVAFLARAGPKLRVRWDLVSTTLAAAAALVVGAHLFLRWLYRELRGPAGAGGTGAEAWRWRWTLSGFALVVLMFAAGTAAVGIVHQAAWLARSPEPMYRQGREPTNRLRCGRNLRQIGYAIQAYADRNGGRYPDGLDQVLRTQDITPNQFVCPSSNDEPAPGRTEEEVAANLLKPGHCSYIYLGKGLSQPVAADRVVAVEPLEHHDDRGMNVLYCDGRAEWLDRPRAEALLEKLGFERVDSPAGGR